MVLTILAVKGYISLAHVNIDKSKNLAVGEMTGNEFWDKYEKAVNVSKGVSLIYFVCY